MNQALPPFRILAEALACIVPACLVPASAQVVAPEQLAAEASPKTSQWGLGFGAGFDKSPLRDFDDEVDPLPLVLYESKHLSVFGARIDYKLPSYGRRCSSACARAMPTMATRPRIRPISPAWKSARAACGWAAPRSGAAAP